MTITTTAGLQDLVQGILLAANTSAGNRVYVPGDWPTWDMQYPALLCRAMRDDKQANSRSGVSFTVTSTIRVTGRVQAPADAGEDGALVAETAAWFLARQVEVAVINQYQLTLQLQQFPFVRTEIKVSSEGREHYAEFVMDIGMEFYQGEEAFCQPAASALTEVNVTVDLVNVYDANGTYLGAVFPSAVNPAPRTSGPDGRAEGVLDIQLQQ